jgi:hypothetical protein
MAEMLKIGGKFSKMAGNAQKWRKIFKTGEKYLKMARNTI